jgi:hypothetical protein
VKLAETCLDEVRKLGEEEKVLRSASVGSPVAPRPPSD